MLRHILIASSLALAALAQAGTVASCEQLDADQRNVELDLDGANIRFDRDVLVIRSGGAELVRIDGQRNLTISGRPVAVPKESRPDLDAYVAGLRQLTAGAEEIGAEGGRIAARAVSGLVSVMFSAATMDEFEQHMEDQGAKLEAKADSLCRTVAELQRTERSLQQRIPAFPNFLSPANPAL